ncbi:hypothetical protein FRZ61_35170 [Hypericibacter adhaerens]|jgi:hypothetical protein|uniref:Uncharacterized protein n=1 Tax=Hypericibacter adhaerens TaxID=2602016 RepID=A0A5J6N167_9PROT|nr:hypothetical protein [Hypericibacter adhaerens]QEX23579.1 hypothetical protein FRZ61_35170 [Hypericibacter adhaerens]
MLPRTFWGGVIELARWPFSIAFGWWGIGLVLLAFQTPGPPTDGPRAILALPLGLILVGVGGLIFLQLGRAKRALLRPH